MDGRQSSTVIIHTTSATAFSVHGRDHPPRFHLAVMPACLSNSQSSVWRVRSTLRVSTRMDHVSLKPAVVRHCYDSTASRSDGQQKMRVPPLLSAIEYESPRGHRETRPSEAVPPAFMAAGGFGSAVFNLYSAMLGAGVLAMPSVMRDAGGVIGGSLMLACGSVITIYATNCLLFFAHETGTGSYERLVEYVFGRRAGRIAALLIITFLVGACVLNVRMTGDLIAAAIEPWYGAPLVKAQRLGITALMWAVFMLPLSLPRQVNALRYASLIGIIAAWALVVALAAFATLHRSPEQLMANLFGTTTAADMAAGGADGTTLAANRSIWLNDATAHHHHHDSPRHHRDVRYDAALLRPSNDALGATAIAFSSPSLVVGVLMAMPTCVFAFDCQLNSFEIFDELRPRTLGRMHWVVTAAVAGCGILYWLIGVGGFAIFGVETETDVLLNFRPAAAIVTMNGTSPTGGAGSSTRLSTTPWYVTLANLGVCLKMVMSFPLNVFPARDAVYHILGLSHGQADDGHSMDVQEPTSPVTHLGEVDSRTRLTVSLVLSIAALLIAFAVPNIDVVLGVLGGVVGSTLSLIVPGVIALSNPDGLWSAAKQGWSRHDTAAVGLLAIGLVTAVLGTYEALAF